MIKLEVKENKVAALLRSGKDFVSTDLNEMTAQRIISEGKVKASDIEGYPIGVNDEWFFAGEFVEAEKKSAPKKAKK